ncbi:MAG TPA: hypothetical protein VL358_01995 [Caulobacteraceae bacterium]|nr:hypothetical protein [Caulobacteraceae bacterium]
MEIDDAQALVEGNPFDRLDVRQTPQGPTEQSGVGGFRHNLDFGLDLIIAKFGNGSISSLPDAVGTGPGDQRQGLKPDRNPAASIVGHLQRHGRNAIAGRPFRAPEAWPTANTLNGKGPIGETRGHPGLFESNKTRFKWAALRYPKYKISTHRGLEHYCAGRPHPFILAHGPPPDIMPDD